MDKINFIDQSTSLTLVISISLFFVFIGIVHSKRYQGLNNYLTANRNIGFFSLSTQLTKSLIASNQTDEKFKNTLNFKDLNINKDQIISIFIDEGVLPKNFLSLERNPNQLPRLKNHGLQKTNVRS